MHTVATTATSRVGETASKDDGCEDSIECGPIESLEMRFVGEVAAAFVKFEGQVVRQGPTIDEIVPESSPERHGLRYRRLAICRVREAHHCASVHIIRDRDDSHPRDPPWPLPHSIVSGNVRLLVACKSPISTSSQRSSVSRLKFNHQLSFNASLALDVPVE